MTTNNIKKNSVYSLRIENNLFEQIRKEANENRRSIAKEIDEKTLDACTEFYTRKYIGNGSPKTTVFKGVKEVLL